MIKKKLSKIVFLVSFIITLIFSTSCSGLMGGGSEGMNITKLMENPIIFFIGVIAVVYLMWKMTHKK